MKLITKMCHTHLMSMLFWPEKFQKAIASYTSTAPDFEGEGFNGYMEVEVEFEIRDLEAFAQLYHASYKLPSDRAQWYHNIKNGAFNGYSTRNPSV